MQPRSRFRCLASAVIAMGVLLSPGVVFAQTGRVSGRIVDEATNQPIRGAAITAVNPQAVPSEFTSVSDNKGRYAMIGLRSGPWMVTISAPGYEPQRGMLQVQSL